MVTFTLGGRPMRNPEDEIRRHLRHNLTVNFLEGTAFWVGMSFYSFQTVLALYISRLSDNPFAVGLLATVGSSGWLLPQLFTAQWTQHTPVKKHIVVRVGFFSERLPLIVLALSTWFLAAHYPHAALILALVTATWLAYGSGLIAVAWQSMITKIIPQDIRGRFLGLTSAVGMAGGTLAAGAVTYILNTYPFPKNFAISFSLGAFFSLLSWVFLALTREPPDPSPLNDSEDKAFWRLVPRILKEDRNYSYFLLARILGALAAMGNGFLAVYAIQHWNLPDGQAGVFNGVYTAAQLGAYILFGILADRHGHTYVLKWGMIAGTLAFLIAALAPSPTWIYLSFADLGFVQASYVVSGMMIVPEFAPPESLALYFGLSSTLPGLISVASPMLGATIAQVAGYPPLFLVSATASAGAWLVYAWRVQDPRKRGQD